MTASQNIQPHRSIATQLIATLPVAALAAAGFRVHLLAACLMACPGFALAADSQWTAPRTTFGAPDLQGIWTNASITNLERPVALGEKRFYTAAEAIALEQRAADMVDCASQPSDPNAGPSAAGNDVGGYNRFWMDPGSQLALVNGGYRTSLIIEPADGRIPYTEAARSAIAAALESSSRFDHPEQRPVNERWLADSVGYYEGDTLVVRTTNFNPYETYRVAAAHRLYVGTQSTVTERFTRISNQQIHYEFTAEDPQYYTQPWKGEFPFNATEDRMFEYACHEGNYALPGILAGGRVAERDQ